VPDLGDAGEVLRQVSKRPRFVVAGHEAELFGGQVQDGEDAYRLCRNLGLTVEKIAREQVVDGCAEHGYRERTAQQHGREKSLERIQPDLDCHGYNPIACPAA
jgi:hypothetical protein